MSDSIFTKIVKGDIPCHKVYENEKTLAFLDIHPVQPGHTLVIPKKEVEFLWDLDVKDYQAVMDTVKKVARRLRAMLPAPYVGVQVIGVDVPHAHVHLIPFHTVEQYRRTQNMQNEPDHESLAKLAKLLYFSDN